MLGRLVLLEPQQAALLERICGGPTITADTLRAAGACEKPARGKKGGKSPGFVQPPTMFGEDGDG